MSYEDLEKARAERIVKEAVKEAEKVAIASKGKHGQKRKSTQAARAPEPKAKLLRMSEAQVEEDEIAPELWKAPVARMW